MRYGSIFGSTTMQIANAHSIDALASSRPGPPAAVVGASWLSPPADAERPERPPDVAPARGAA